MSGEKLLDAFQFIDDDMIESVNVLRKYPERHKHLWVNYVAVAACVVLAIFGGFKYLDGNTPTQENSSASDSAEDMNIGANDCASQADGDVDNTNVVDENKEFRDEFAGSTSNTTGDVCFAATVYMEITEIGDNSFKGKVLKKAVVGNTTHFDENQIVTVIYSESTNKNLHTLLIEDLSVGEKVYVFYGKIESDTIYTPRIQYELF